MSSSHSINISRNTAALSEVSAAAPQAPAHPALPLSALSRAQNCLVAGALGDALGYAVEFNSWQAIRAEHGPNGIQELQINSAGEAFCSDDTQMTLFLQEGLLLSSGPHDDLDSARQAFLEWRKTQHEPQTQSAPGMRSEMARKESNLWRAQAPGMTCLSALGAGGLGTMIHPINDSKGCGGVMRAAPAAFVGFWRENWTARKAWTLGAEQAALTHGHPEGWASSGAAAALVFELLRGQSLRSAAATALLLTDELAGGRAPLTVALGQKALDMDATNPPAPKALVEALGQGWVGEEAFAIGLYGGLVAEASIAVNGLRVAANHSGDSDSTASLAGQFLGAAGLADDWVMENESALDLIGAIDFCHTALIQRAHDALGLDATQALAAAFSRPLAESRTPGSLATPEEKPVTRHGFNMAALADEAESLKEKGSLIVQHFRRKLGL